MFVFHILERKEIKAVSNVIFSNLNALIKSGFLVFGNGVFIFTNTQVLLIAFKLIIDE